MNPKSSPPHMAALSFVHGHLNLETFGKDLRKDLETVRKFQAWLVNPAGSVNLQHITSPHGTAPLVATIPYRLGALLTQRPAPEGELPRFMYPMPGQACRLIGSPEGFKVEDGTLWNEEEGRWEALDSRVLVNTPEGVTVLTLDAEALIQWTEHSPVDPVQAEAARILESMEAHILDALKVASELEGSDRAEV